MFCRAGLLLSFVWMAAGLSFLHAQGPARNQAQSRESLQALQLEQQGRFAEAEQAWQQITVQNPRSVQAWAQLGLVRARLEEYPSAIPAYEHALKLDPKLPGLQLDLGLAYFKTGKFREAVLPLRAAATEKPDDAGLKTLLGMSYFGSAQYREAVPYLQASVKASPENLQLRGVLAQSCLYDKQYDCTLEQYKQIITVDPDSVQAHMLAGEAFDGLHRTLEAISEFEQAVKASPKEPNVHFGLGYLLWTQRHYEEAAQQFQQELENDPTHAQAMAYLGDAQIRLGENDAARATLEKAVKLPDTVRIVWLDLGILHAADQQNDEAVADFLHAIEMDPSEVDAHWRLARLYQSMGKKAEAQAEFAKARKLHEETDEGLVRRMSGGHAAPPPQPQQ
uniref:Tetratricopeptide repeat protein n=1 Tax=Paracidobacterium acidisoli TaxID=2303751 RepID=A0A372IU31_9BACT|nr:tetratricopeptide repeat protein [Paracidobacterium acidisoli]